MGYYNKYGSLLIPKEKPAILVYHGSDTQEPNQSVYTYSSKSIGAATADRFAMVAVHGHDGSGSKDVLSVTIGGVNATKLLDAMDASGVCSGDWWGAVVPSGTTADIVCTHATTCTKHGISWYTGKGLKSYTPVDTLVVNTAGATPLAGNIDVLAGGFILCAATVQSAVATYAFSGVTERYDGIIGTSNGSFGVGDYEAAVSETNRAISVAISAAQTRQIVSAISMR